MSLDQDTVKRIVEGALFAAGQPMKLDKLAGLFLEEEAPPTEMLVEAINQLKEEYASRGVMLKEVASGFRFQVQESVGEWVSRLWEEKPARYSRALLETLALIAYRQPITRGEIEEIRGVSVSSHITKTLLEREWIRVVGHRDVPGRPAMYGTTRTFLDYFNLKNLDELPSLAEIRDLDTINAELELVQRGLDPNGQLDVDESDVEEGGDGDLTGQSDSEEGDDHSRSEAGSQPAESEVQTVAQSALDTPTETEHTGDPKPGELT
ncbi:SMC-Scp complex subunit ScpB [Ketobacter sp.]|uniref:SMC-Scp complex subunit ScpB n=1 Tax=Ketobacter sp. TaxID=2083498 RepID=UPI000F2B9B1B|nr:SMC-Scp complex subunit ScpB [Ketobacter sp.]RLT92521.1 MAG: SMC-Scp complex subunit ScpB [Ketobacter sp.]